MATAVKTDPDGNAPQFNLPLAPVVTAPDKYKTVNLGEYDPAYTDWLIVVDSSLPLDINDMAVSMADTSIDLTNRLAIMREWIEMCLVAWNFVRPSPGGAVPLPQPREGGAGKCPMEVLPLIAKAVVASYTPPKD